MDTSVEAITAMITESTKLTMALEKTADNIRNSKEEASRSWNDEKIREAGEMIEEMIGELYGESARISRLIPSLQVLKDMLIDYLEDRRI